MSSELIRYRRAGGMAGLDQRLTVFEDGRVTLEDRKARGRSEVQATATELATLHSLVDSVPAHRWHGGLGALARSLLPRHHEAMRFELRRGSDRIYSGAGIADVELARLLAELDELLARAVRERRVNDPGAGNQTLA